MFLMESLKLFIRLQFELTAAAAAAATAAAAGGGGLQ